MGSCAHCYSVVWLGVATASHRNDLGPLKWAQVLWLYLGCFWYRMAGQCHRCHGVETASASLDFTSFGWASYDDCTASHSEGTWNTR